ncbi:NitT/TauT family transport system substrate-binding protein [Caloramator quimbayensis]|uniref:NitT/TauT family transport system substrate-binding protein n=1 Tax=Caloramator quimbayensis TaxID=1147123 RepID=A0A1T4XFB6_9CLOT|nr:MetQ/NlpA family ABC transporter substrate-binding protein [Caloramator quimbayensis]SKA87878.1 NitT/TauT family transport system substrate-binding protein [Caloramator quimbayensis]
MKKILSLVLAFILTVSLSSCSFGKKTMQELTIGVLPDVDSIPLIIAQQQGYFEKEGIKVNVQHFKSAKDRDSAFQAGKLDGAVSDVLAAAFAKEGGFDVKITSMTNGSYKLLINKNLGISKIEDLKGKSIAISKNTIIEYSCDMMLKEANVSSEDVKKIVVPQIPVRLEMLQNGKIDSAVLPDPLSTVAVKNGAVLLNSTDKLNINPGVLIFNTNSIKSKEKEIKAFYAAYNKAVEFFQKQPVESYIDVLIKEAGFPEDVKGSIILPKYTKASLPSEKDVEDVIRWLKEKQLIKNEYKFNELVDGNFVR